MALPGYGVYDPNLPPDIATDAQSIARKRAIAEALFQQGMQPLPAQRVPYHWTQGLASLAEAFAGRKGMERADTASGALGQRYQQGLADEVKRIAAMRQGSPATTENIVDEQAAGGEGATATISAPAVAADPRASVRAAMYSQYAPVREEGKLEYAHLKKADEPYTLKPSETRVTPGQPNVVAPDKAIVPMVEHNFPVGNNQIQSHISYDRGVTWQPLPGSKPIDKFGPRTDQAPAVTSAEVIDPKDPTRMLKVDARTYKGGTLGEAGVIGVSGRLGDIQKANVKRQIASQGVGDAIGRARDLLTGRGGESLPTQSGIGAAVDYAASIFGKTPAGAATADKLKVVGGSLVQKVPRFEGPQSDKDVSYYKEVAGRIGDPTLPIERRLAALDEVENIWGQFESGKKYGYFSPTGPSYSGPERRVLDEPPPGAVRPR